MDEKNALVRDRHKRGAYAMGGILHGVSLGQGFYHRLKQGTFMGTVHSVFHRVCNLVTIEGELYSLALPRVGNSPNGILVLLPAGEDFLSWGIKEGSGFEALGTNILLMEHCVIDLSKAELWTQEDVLDPVSPQQMLKNLIILKNQVVRDGFPQGLGGLLADKPPDSYLIQAVLKVWIPLREAIRSQDQVGVYRGARSLIGLGPGLTPAGDDFLSGFMSSLYWGTKALGMETPGVLRCNGEVVRAAKGRTNLISYTQILYASRGQTPEQIFSLLKALYYGDDEEQLRKAVKKMLEMGSTSGSDLMAGIGMAMEFLLTENILYQERSAQIWL